MKNLALLLILVGLIWGMFAFNMKTTITTESLAINGFVIPSTSVNNIGLMDERRNQLMLTGLMILVGSIFLAATYSKSPKLQPEPADNTRNCPYCAEFVKIEAIICKHCGKDIPAIDLKQATQVEANPTPVPLLGFGVWSLLGGVAAAITLMDLFSIGGFLIDLVSIASLCFLAVAALRYFGPKHKQVSPKLARVFIGYWTVFICATIFIAMIAIFSQALRG